MTAITGLVTLPSHRLASHRPTESHIGITAFGEVGKSSVFYINKSYILIIHASAALISCENPTAVGTPFKGKVSIGIREINALKQGFGLAAVGICNHDFGTVAKICHLFAIRRNHRLEADFTGRAYTLLFYLGSEGEVFVFLVFKNGAVDAPLAPALGSIINAAPVFSE